jgi:hypothetical protein
MLNYDDNCFKSYNQESEIQCELRDLYADIYRTKLAIPPEERESLANEKIRSWRRPIAAGSRGGEIKECKITLQPI